MLLHVVSTAGEEVSFGRHHCGEEKWTRIENLGDSQSFKIRFRTIQIVISVICLCGSQRLFSDLKGFVFLEVTGFLFPQM